MYIYFRCETCGQKIKSDYAHRGDEVDCPNCGRELEVPFIPIGPGVIVGGFLLEEEIGEGGMGRVYRALQKSMNRPAALKILSSTLTFEETMVQRFLKEAKTMAGLRHPHLVRAYDAGEDDGTYYLAMEYVDGAPLDDVVEGGGPIDWDACLHAARSVAGALRYAWEDQRVIHRDVKPANIMVDQDGEPRLLDMGLARSTESMHRLTVTGEVLGTPELHESGAGLRRLGAGLPDRCVRDGARRSTPC